MLTVLALGAVLGIGLFVRSRSGGTFGAGAPSASASERVVPVPVITVTARDLPVVLDALGSVAAYNTVTVKSQVDGRIDKIFFTEGGSVKAGELLVQIDPRPFAIQAQLAAAALMRDKAVLTNAKLVLARNENLLKQGVGSQQAVDDARAEVAKNEGVVAGDAATAASAQLQLDFARASTRRSTASPGVRQVDVGNVVRPSDANGIVVITQIDPIAVLFTLPQDDLPRISSEMARGALPVEVFSRDGSQLLAKGEQLAVIDNQINEATATVRLKAVFANPGARALARPVRQGAAAAHHRAKGALVGARGGRAARPAGALRVRRRRRPSGCAMRPVEVATHRGRPRASSPRASPSATAWWSRARASAAQGRAHRRPTGRGRRSARPRASRPPPRRGRARNRAAAPRAVSISEPFIRRPVATSLLMVALLLVGLVAFRQLPVAPLPQVDYPTIVVATALPGASAETMASSVTTPSSASSGRSRRSRR